MKSSRNDSKNNTYKLNEIFDTNYAMSYHCIL